MLYFDLWTLLVEQLVGSFILTVLVLAAIIFLIMAVLGKMSRVTVMYYEILFLITMTAGYGYKMFSIILGFALLAWWYIEFKTSTSG